MMSIKLLIQIRYYIIFNSRLAGVNISFDKSYNTIVDITFHDLIFIYRKLWMNLLLKEVSTKFQK